MSLCRLFLVDQVAHAHRTCARTRTHTHTHLRPRHSQECGPFLPVMIPPWGRYKTRLCNDHAAGTCKLGDWCNFAHSEGERREPLTVSSEEMESYWYEVYYKTDLCWHHQNGQCSQGEQCSFAHSEAEKRHVRLWCGSCGRPSRVALTRCLDPQCQPTVLIHETPMPAEDVVRETLVLPAPSLGKRRLQESEDGQRPYKRVARACERAG